MDQTPRTVTAVTFVGLLFHSLFLSLAMVLIRLISPVKYVGGLAHSFHGAHAIAAGSMRNHSVSIAATDI